MNSGMRELIAKWRRIGDAKHEKARGPFVSESDKIANLAEGDLCHQFANELDALLARTEAGADECTLGVGDGSGQLFVHGSYDAIKACQALILRGERDDWPKTVVVSSGDMCFTADWDGEYFVTRSPIKLDDAAIALMRGQSWQPIETAPRDGTSILATEIDGEPVVSYFYEGGWVYSWHAYDGYRHWNPTHWQSLPAPPKDTADEQ